jgi:hypothetical protein
MNIDAKKLRDLAQAATQPSSWTVYKNSDGTVNVLDANGMWVAEVGHAPHDAAFIAAANPQTVIALLDEVERLRQDLELATGPHCDSCGNPIDPEWCHCGSAVASHGAGDGHAPVPMGCVCGYHDEDFKRLAASRGERIWQMRRELASTNRRIDDLTKAAELAAVKGVAAGKLVAAPELALVTAARDEACDLLERLFRGEPFGTDVTRSRIATLRKAGAK